MRSRRLTPFVAAAAVALTALGLDGCSGNSSIGPSGNSTSQTRAFNGLQGCSTNIDIEQLNVTPVQFQNVAYAAVPGAYTSLRSGLGLHYAVFPTGQTSSALALADIDLIPHDPGGDPNSGTYTLAATGICGGGSGSTTPHLVRLQDAFPSAFTGSNVSTVALRVINLVPDLTGGVTLASNGSAVHGSDDAGTNNVNYAGNSGFNSSHYNAGINLAGSTQLTIRTNANAILANVPNFTFTPNHAYTLFVVGEVNPTAGGQAITVVPVQDF